MLFVLYRIQNTNHRIAEIADNPSKFTEYTINDVGDHKNSQFFRRYGHLYNMSLIEEISRINAVIATAKSSLGIMPLHFFVDTIRTLGRIPNQESFSRTFARLFPHYISTLVDWSEEPSESEDTEKAFIRVKFIELQTMMSASVNLASKLTIKDQIHHLVTSLAPRSLAIQPSPLLAQDIIQDSVLISESDCYEIRIAMKKVCHGSSGGSGGSPVINLPAVPHINIFLKKCL